jgi:hypothetical protein
VKNLTPLESKPHLHADLELDYSAFHVLNASRTAGFSGPDSLQLTEILAFMEMFNITSVSERRILLRRLRILDRAFMSYFNETHKSKETKSGKPVRNRNKNK